MSDAIKDACHSPWHRDGDHTLGHCMITIRAPEPDAHSEPRCAIKVDGRLGPKIPCGKVPPCTEHSSLSPSDSLPEGLRTPSKVEVRAMLTALETEHAADLLAEQWPKRCGCGAVYLPPGSLAPRRVLWAYLPRAYQRTDSHSTNEARHCPCGSTLEIILAVHDLEAA